MARIIAVGNFGAFSAAVLGELPFGEGGNIDVQVPIEKRFEIFHLEIVENGSGSEIGWAQLTFWLRKTDFKTLSVDEMWLDEVSSSYCNRGIGTWLISLFEKWAKEFGAEVITSDLSMSRAGLQRRLHFFSKNGYTVVRKPKSRNLAAYKRLMPEARVPGDIGKGRVVRNFRNIF